jgi:hypothetical protein
MMNYDGLIRRDSKTVISPDIGYRGFDQVEQ